MVGAFQVNTWVAPLAATGMILGAAYMLWLYRRVIFGKLDARPTCRTMLDLNRREMAIFAPLVAARALDGHLSELRSCDVHVAVGRAARSSTTRRALADTDGAARPPRSAP